jgi:hypothetical protein
MNKEFSISDIHNNEQRIFFHDKCHLETSRKSNHQYLHEQESNFGFKTTPREAPKLAKISILLMRSSC